MNRPTTDAPQVQVAVVQVACSDSKQANVQKTLDGLADAAARGAQVVCLQELFHGLYPCQTEDHARFAEAEPIPGPISQALADAAKRHHLVIVGSLFERRAPGLYHNTAVVFDADGSTAGVYRKMHIPDDPRYYEKFYFTPGDLGFRSFATRVGQVGVCVCWDQWFPEAARLTALTGAQILCYPTAIGWLPEEKGPVRRQPASGLGNHDAQPCHRQWRFCRRSEPSRIGKRYPILGRVVGRRSLRQSAGSCRPRRGRDADRSNAT
jgi:N-carbamoylputrescine amidase